MNFNSSNSIYRTKNKLPVAVLLLVAVASGCQLTSQGHNVAGVHSFNKGDYASASSRFIQALADDPLNPDSYYNIAAVNHRIGNQQRDPARLREAEHYYHQCLDRNPNHVSCYRGLAVLLTETNRSDKATHLIERWASANPHLPDPKVELARLKEEFNKPEEAKRLLLDALTTHPKHPRALAAMGKLREQAGEYEQAIENYRRSLSANRFQPELEARIANLMRSVPNHVSQMMAPPPTTSMAHNSTRISRF